MKFSEFAVASVAFALLSLPASESVAQSLPLQVKPNQLDRTGGSRPSTVVPQLAVKISERQAVSLARERYAGNVLRIGLIGQGNSMRYQIRMENEGKVFTVFVNAASGRVTRGG